MRRFVLLVAEWVVGVAGLCLLVYGISLMLTAGQLLVGIGCVVGAFILVAQAVVFDHVSGALAAAETRATTDPEDHRHGTPWEDDPGHTTE